MVAKPKVPEMDMSLGNWIYNTRFILHFPVTIIIVTALLVMGTFAETAPRKSLEFLDSTFGKIIFFIVPLFIAHTLDWPTGLLAATVCLIIFTRLQKVDVDEGFTDSPENSDVTTKIISSPHRWFIEKILGESPLAISSDRIHTSTVQDESQRTSTTASSSSGTSGNTSAPDIISLTSSSSNK